MTQFTDKRAAAMRPAAAFALGVDGWYTFDLGCNRAELLGTPFYGLLLESPASPMPNAFSWYGSGADPYPGLPTQHQDWAHDGPGWTPMLPLVGGTWDFTFHIFTC